MNLRGPAPSGERKVAPEEVTKIRVHYLPPVSPGQPVTLEWLEKEHRLRGALRCLFHYVVNPDGSLSVGTPLNLPGLERGTVSVAVCLDRAFPTMPQRRAADTLKSTLLDTFENASVF